jgi:hypothetical protein
MKSGIEVVEGDITMPAVDAIHGVANHQDACYYSEPGCSPVVESVMVAVTNE